MTTRTDLGSRLSGVPTEGPQAAVLAKLEAAEAGNDELSARVMQSLVVPNGSVRQSPFNGAWCVYDGLRLWERRGGWHRPDGWPVTTSLDAALALAERVLADDWAIYVEKRPHWSGGPTWSAHVTDGCVVREDWLAPTPALALCIAILRATTAAETGASGYEAKRSEPKNEGEA
jgi:hypothetical protein